MTDDDQQHRRGRVIFWTCLVLGVVWLSLFAFLIWMGARMTTGEGPSVQFLIDDVTRNPFLLFFGVLPPLVLFGLGVVAGYRLSRTQMNGK